MHVMYMHMYNNLERLRYMNEMMFCLGEIRETTKRSSTGAPVTIKDLALGDAPVEVFCPNCEVRFTF